jgi:hypothetical protein
VIVLLPVKVASGVNTLWLLVELLVVAKKLELTALPLFFQIKVSASEFESDPVAVKVVLAPTPTMVPEAFGVCAEHTGGMFLLMVQVFESELLPFVTVA